MSDEVWTTLIATGGTVVVAYITQVVAKRVIATRKSKRSREVDDEESEAVERYVADPGQFVKDILESNRQYADEVKAYRNEVNGLRQELEDMRVKERTRLAALARWFIDIANKFTEHGIEMPYPRESDREILADIIPFALEATQPRRPPRPAH